MITEQQIHNKTNKKADRSYDWAAYYESAYKALKEKNIQTVLEIEKQQQNVETLKQAEKFIVGNRFWQVMTPVRKVCDKVDCVTHPAPKPATDEMRAAYEEQVYSLKHRYQMWMREKEPQRMEPYKEIDEAVLEKYYFITTAPGLISEKAPAVWTKYLKEHSDAVLAYADEDFFTPVKEGEPLRMHPWLKPCWSPETLLSFFYFGSYIALRKDAVEALLNREELEQLLQDLSLKEQPCGTENRKTAETENIQSVKAGNRQLVETENIQLTEAMVKLYSLVLQCCLNCTDKQVVHVPEILFHRQFCDYTEEELEQVTANRNWDRLQRLEAVLQDRLEQGQYMWGQQAAFSKMKTDFLKSRGIAAHMEPAMEPAEYHVVYDTEWPLVSAVILSKDHPDTLELCLKSLRERTDYPNLELIVVDNGSNASNKEKIELLKNKYGFNYLYNPMEFNFSTECNLGVDKATGECILLLNDDIEVFEKSWLRRMVGQAMQPGIGAVGARLLYAGTNKIQHAGITNLRVGPSHKLMACPDDVNYYFGRNRVTYDMLGVTAACLLVTKAKYLEVGGLEESMRVAYNDVDFCFKLYEKGYRNVLRNDAVLYHYESLSRGLDAGSQEKWARLLQEKKKLYEAHPALKGVDPYYHELLADDSSEYRILYSYPAENKTEFARISKRDAGILAKTEEVKVSLQVDHADFCLHEEPENPDYYWVSGWSYLHGEDQCKYKKRLLFKNEKEEIFEGMYFIEYRNDVEEMLFAKQNVSAAGFCTRFVKGSLNPGSYRVGMLYEDMLSGKKYLTWSERNLEILENT